MICNQLMIRMWCRCIHTGGRTSTESCMRPDDEAEEEGGGMLSDGDEGDYDDCE